MARVPFLLTAWILVLGMPLSVRPQTGAQTLQAPERFHTVTCTDPQLTPCVIRKPPLSHFKLLSTGFQLDDQGSYWLGDFTKDPPRHQSTQRLRLVTGIGEIHNIDIHFQLSAAAEPALTVSKPGKSKPPSSAPVKPAASRPLAAQQPNTDGRKAAPAGRLPCISEVCIGDDFSTLKASLAPASPLDERLLQFVTLDTQGPNPGLDARQLRNAIRRHLKQLEAGQTGEFLDGLLALARQIAGPGSDQLRANATDMVDAYHAARQASPGRPAAAHYALLPYLTPEVSPPAPAPEAFMSAPRRFDNGFQKAMNTAQPRFCQPLTWTATFPSATGYPTHVSLMPDTDGRLRVARIQRIYPIRDANTRSALRQELRDLYRPFFDADPQARSLAGVDGMTGNERAAASVATKDHIELVLLHPMLLQAENGEPDPAQLARWNRGWLALKDPDQVLTLARMLSAQAHCQVPRAPIE